MTGSGAGGGAVDDYRRHMERKGLRPRSIKKMLDVVSLLSRHIAPRTVLEATETDVESFVDCRQLAPRTRYMYISTLHGLFEWAVIYGLLDRDPTMRVVRPRLPRAVPHPIQDDDLRTLLATADPRAAAMIALAALHGLRAQEVAGVQRSDILDRNTPAVLTVVAGKGGHQRVVPLHAEGWALIEPVAPRRGYLFTDPLGRPLAPWAVSHIINGLLCDLGIDSTCHSLRHWYGTNIYRVSRDLRVTQVLMGHASPNTTAGYIQFSSEDAHIAVAGIGL